MSHLTVSRRQLMLAAGAAALAGGLPMQPLRASEHTVDLGGGVTIKTFTDGYLTLPSTFPAPAVEAAKRVAAMAAANQTGDTYKSPINVTMITTPTDKILVDVGSGAHFMATAGKLSENLETAGIDREAITQVIYTHAHPDHIWGTYDEFDELTFPQASFHMSEAEHAYWSDPKTVDT
ncbi:MAG: MBL fold metallo-hydrolase, partial [Pseudomonadota bacterium]